LNDYNYSSEDDNSKINKNYDDEIVTKSFRKRCCSKITQGSFRAALISACIFSLGPAIHSMAFKFSKVGLFIGWGILLMASLTNYMTMNILLKLSIVYKKNSYPSLVKRVMGTKLSKLFDVIVILGNLGAFTLFFVISNSIYNRIL